MAHWTFVAALSLVGLGLTIPGGWARADCFEHHAARFGLEPELLQAIALVESGGRPHAVNGAHQGRTGTRDLGLMQINSAWLPRLNRHGIREADLFEPCTSIEVGAWVLADLIARYGNTWDAVGAYNAACTQLKGAACTKARARYTWLVHRRLEQIKAARAAAEPRKALEAPRTAERPQLVALTALNQARTNPSSKSVPAAAASEPATSVASPEQGT